MVQRRVEACARVREVTPARAARLLRKGLPLGAEGVRLLKEQFPAALYIKAGFDAGFLRYTYFLAEKGGTVPAPPTRRDHGTAVTDHGRAARPARPARGNAPGPEVTMLAIEEGGGRGAIVVVTASGRLAAEDYRRFTPAFERLARSRGPLRVLLELRGFRGWDAGALWEELKFDVTHQWAFRRIAVVGERRWQGWGTWLSRPLFRAEMRYFDRSRMEEARAWLGL